MGLLRAKIIVQAISIPEEISYPHIMLTNKTRDQLTPYNLGSVFLIIDLTDSDRRFYSKKIGWYGPHYSQPIFFSLEPPYES